MLPKLVEKKKEAQMTVLRCVLSLLAIQIALSAPAPEASAPPILAIIVEGEAGGSSLPDIIFGELSTANGLRLVERSALSRIRKELELSLGASAGAPDSLRLGKMSGASFLLVVNRGEKSLDTRILEVASGKVVFGDSIAVRDDPFLTAGEIRQKTLESLRLRTRINERLAVGIAAFQNRSPTKRSDPFGSDLEKALRERLRKMPWATVVERQYPTALLGELELKRLGLVKSGRSDLPSADLIIFGSYLDSSSVMDGNKNWGIDLSLYVKLRGAVSSLKIRSGAEQADSTAERLIDKIQELRVNAPSPVSALAWIFAVTICPLILGDAAAPPRRKHSGSACYSDAIRLVLADCRQPIALQTRG